MRILPVNNYNYQSQSHNKAQSNKQQSVQFGMLHGSAVDAERLCKAGFKGVADAIINIGHKIFGITSCPTPEEAAARRSFRQIDLSTLFGYLSEAKTKNMVMSPEEERTLTRLFEQPETDISNQRLLEVIRTEIEQAKPVTEEIKDDLERLERYGEEEKRLNAKMRAGLTKNNVTASAQERSRHFHFVHMAKNRLYAASVAK